MYTCSRREIASFTGKTLCDVKSELGEGPSYDQATDTAWWFDIKGQKLHELHLGSGTKRVHDLPFLGSVIATIDPSRQLIASDQGLFIRETQSGKLGPYCKLEDKPVNRSNDGRVHQSGALWIGTMGRSAEKESGAIYHVAGTKVTQLLGGVDGGPKATSASPAASPTPKLSVEAQRDQLRERMEAGGIEPPSESASPNVSTCVARDLMSPRLLPRAGPSAAIRLSLASHDAGGARGQPE